MSRIDEEKRVVGLMIDIWERRHTEDNCTALRAYCMARLERCTFGNDKPTCKQCPVHCYNPKMREHIRLVMRYSGPRMIFYHPLLALRHLFREKPWRKTK